MKTTQDLGGFFTPTSLKLLERCLGYDICFIAYNVKVSAEDGMKIYLKTTIMHDGCIGETKQHVGRIDEVQLFECRNDYRSMHQVPHSIFSVHYDLSKQAQDSCLSVILTDDQKYNCLIDLIKVIAPFKTRLVVHLQKEIEPCRYLGEIISLPERYGVLMMVENTGKISEINPLELARWCRDICDFYETDKIVPFFNVCHYMSARNKTMDSFPSISEALDANAKFGHLNVHLCYGVADCEGANHGIHFDSDLNFFKLLLGCIRKKDPRANLVIEVQEDDYAVRSNAMRMANQIKEFERQYIIK